MDIKDTIPDDGWITAGNDVRDGLLQYNVKTGEWRTLDKWVEIWEDEKENKQKGTGS